MLHERLRYALKMRGINKKAFALTLRGRGIAGVSYPTVLGYFDGTAEPSLAWIRAAADVLDVRPEWLAFGSSNVEAGPSASDIVVGEIKAILAKHGRM